MRLKPSEARIVNQIRGMQKGRIIIDKAAEGDLRITTRQTLPGRPQEAQPVTREQLRRLRD